MEISLATMNSDEIIEMIEQLAPENYDDQDVCRVDFSISYSTQNLVIKLTENLKEQTLKDQDVQIDTVVRAGQDKDVYIVHFLEYACSIEGCELEFIEKYLSWLIDFDHPDLPDQLAPLLFGDDEQPGRCFNLSGTVQECQSKQCAAQMTRNNNEESPIYQICVSSESLISARLQFKMVFNSNLGHMSQQYTFRCNYDECNDINIASQAFEIFQQEYELEAIFQMFGYKNEDGGTNEPITRTSVESSSSVRSSTATNRITSTTIRSTTKSASMTTSTQSTTVTNSATKPDHNQTNTTTETSSGSCYQSTTTMIYAVWVVSIHRLLFRG